MFHVPQNRIQSNFSWASWTRLASVHRFFLECDETSTDGRWVLVFFMAPQVYEWNHSNHKNRKSELAHVMMSQCPCLSLSLSFCYQTQLFGSSYRSLKITIVINVTRGKPRNPLADCPAVSFVHICLLTMTMKFPETVTIYSISNY